MKPLDPYIKNQLQGITNAVTNHRFELDWSQRTLAEKAGICFTTIAKVEAGYQYYSLPSLIHICKAYKISLAELFEWTGL